MWIFGMGTPIRPNLVPRRVHSIFNLGDFNLRPNDVDPHPTRPNPGLKTRTKLIITEVSLYGISGVLLVFFILNIITLKPLLVLQYLISLYSIRLWFSRTDEIAKATEK